MSVLSSPHFLPRVLWVDAAACAASGLLQLAGGAPLAGLLGLPKNLLGATGLFLLGYAVLVVLVARCPVLPRTMVWLLVAGNLLWAVDCAMLLASGWVAPTRLGTAYVVVQALTVLVLAELQWFGLRRGGRRVA